MTKTDEKQETKNAVVVAGKHDIAVPQAVDPQQLIMMAIEKGTSVDVLERLMAMSDKIKKDYAEQAFREAMSRFQAECPVIQKKRKVFEKDSTTKVRYRYAPLDDIIKVVQPFISKNDLSYDIETVTTLDPSAIKVTVSVFHVMGHSKQTSFSVPVDTNAFMSAPQRWASAQTFAKRYAFCNAFGILTGDEDNDAPDPEKPKKDAEKEKAKKEAAALLEKLPANVKKGFEVLGYTQASQFAFCAKFKWDNGIILQEINKIVDMNEKTKGAK
jgi:hypothetical protein